MDVADHTLELLKRFHAEFTDFRREQETLRMRVSSLGQHFATMSGDIANINGRLDAVQSDISSIKRRMDLVDA